MKNIKFRVKIKNGVEWIWKYFEVEDLFILFPNDEIGWDYNLFDWKTKSQFVDLQDKNNEDVYEGDIVQFDFEDNIESGTRTEVVTWSKINTGYYPFIRRRNSDVKNILIVGNKYEKMK